MGITLRPYQKSQLDFINRKLPGKLPIAIESPTGSGKSYVILEFIRDQIEKAGKTDLTIVLTTGFNNLVYQMEEDARNTFNMNPIVFVGSKHRVCGYKIMKRDGLEEYPQLKDGYSAFSSDKSIQCDSKCGKNCEGQHTLQNQARRAIRETGPKLIITNHSSYLLSLKYGAYYPDIVIVDESHTFSTFYDSFLKVSVSRQEINLIKSTLSDRDPTFMLFSRAIEKNMKISPQIFKQIKEKLEKSGEPQYGLISRLMEFAEAKPSISEFVSISNKGMELTKFWSSYDIGQKDISYILFSATQDSFTRDMFGVTRGRFYIEDKVNTIDYKQSELLVIGEKEFSVGVQRFLEYVSEKGLKKGLILSTTNKDVRYLNKLGSIEGYKVITNIEEFEQTDEKSILVGSRALFQGVDILGLEFVGLNKIPFPTYDKEYQARQRYLNEVARMNTWYQFTIPEVKNTITQATGRLWRRPGDKGVIGIFDERLINGKFNYLINEIKDTRRGININIFESDIEETFDKLEEIDEIVEE